MYDETLFMMSLVPNERPCEPIGKYEMRYQRRQTTWMIALIRVRIVLRRLIEKYSVRVIDAVYIAVNGSLSFEKRCFA